MDNKPWMKDAQSHGSGKLDGIRLVWGDEVESNLLFHIFKVLNFCLMPFSQSILQNFCDVDAKQQSQRDREKRFDDCSIAILREN